ncbi:hypothetical protein [Burkholderia vietnamiensis]|uniref:hypothetical protein n=1 Tax=Burkholderia vietnamiensis TaxID=60552 RepID=UPI0018DB23FA|nr:hypothetical protein [Burkholderia vietnamiensis]MBH9647563.1 hypothetical protein [Burkholderia vietnamiensis]
MRKFAMLIFLLTSTCQVVAQDISSRPNGHQTDYPLMIGGESHLHSGLAGGPKQSQLGTAGKGTGRSADTQKAGKTAGSIGISMAPLLGAPKDYTERYEANLGNEITEQAGEGELSNYGLTPQEKMLSARHAGRTNGSPPNLTSLTTQNGKSRHSSNKKIFDSAAGISTSVESGGDVRAGDSIYRNPW